MGRAYLIYECKHGWCITPVDPPYMGKASRIFAFSRLSQALWFLGREVKAADNETQEARNA